MWSNRKFLSVFCIIILFHFSGNCQQIVYDLQLTKKDSLFYFQNNLYNGEVAVIYPSGQVKQKFMVKDGVSQGTIYNYFEESNYNKSKFLDTAIIRSLDQKISQKNQKIKSIIRDTIENRNRINKYIEEEIGGLKKLEKLKEKSSDGDLNKKKQAKMDSLNYYILIQKQSQELLTQTQKDEQGLQDIKNKEQSKQQFSPKIETVYDHFNFAKNGSYKKYAKNEKLESEGSYLRNKKNGEWKYYDQTGQTTLIENYKDDIKDGAYKKYVGSIIIEEGNYSDGFMTGEWIFRFNNQSGNISGRGNYLLGDGGDIGTSGIPRNGREGQWTFYYEDGALAEENTYVKGLLSGYSKDYYSNGKLKKEGNYLNGKEDGLIKNYFNNGILKSEEIKQNDKRNGMCKYYHPNGKIKHEGNYINDKSEGIHKYYFDTGIIESEENLSQDERNGLCKYYHPNGKIKQEGNYINEKSDGLFKYYFDNGGIEAIENFKQDERNGICKYYYPNGKLKQEGNYINGKSDGIFRFYFETGILQTEQNKKNGKSHGIIKTYYENGQIRIKGTIDTTSMYENNYLGDLYNYNEDGTLKGHWYINRDGTEVDKLASSNNSIATSNNTNTSNSTDENRPYKCICCKSTINGLKEGVDKSGSQYSDKYLYLYENGFKMDNNLRRSLGFPTYSSVYEYLRSEYFVFCTMKCSKLCAER